MQKADSGAHGIKWGLAIGGIYCLLLLLKYQAGAGNAILFGLVTVAGYVAVLVLLFFCGLTLRRKNGGAIEMREAFKAMFIAVLIFEFFFASFTFIYIKYLDPGFFPKLRNSTESLLVAAKQPQGKIDETLQQMDALAIQSRSLGLFDFLKSYLFYVGVTGLFALIYAFIIKRKPPFQQDNFLQPQ